MHKIRPTYRPGEACASQSDLHHPLMAMLAAVHASYRTPKRQ
jgi:hypothetical protein